MESLGRLLFVLAILLAASSSIAESIRIVAFGGSNTAGKGVWKSSAYPAQLEAMLRSKGYDVQVTNAGVSAITTVEELATVNAAVPPGTDIVIFQPGGNDWNPRLTRGGDSIANIQKIVQLLVDRRVMVILAATKQIHAKIPNPDKKFWRIGEINHIGKDHLSGDGIHLTAEGYRIVAEKMLPLVIKLIERKAGSPQGPEEDAIPN